MPALMLIPFVAFAGCVLGQIWLSRQVRRLLATNHPQVWLDLSSKAIFADNAIYGFIWNRRDKALNDPELTQTVQRMRQLQLAALAIWLIYAAMILSGVGVHRA